MAATGELFCHRCGERFASETRFCPHDGVRVFSASVAARVGQQLDNYNLIDILDAGAMAVVYLAEHAVLGKRVAIKILKEDIAERESAAERFLREALAISRLEHPNIVDVTDCSTAPDGTPYFVMELLQGETLEATLTREQALPLYRAAGIVRQIAGALGAAHDGGVVHRDLKPANVFLSTREGHRRMLRIAEDEIAAEPEQAFDYVKVIDFGVAKQLDTGVAAIQATQVGLVLGTPAYMAPEQINGSGVDGRTDIYALGAVFYELVTGTPPFGGETVLEVLNGHVYGAVDPPAERNPTADINATTSAVLLRCLEKNPAKRFQTAEALGEALIGCFTDRVQVRDAARLIARRNKPGDGQAEQRLAAELAELFAGSEAGPSAPRDSPPRTGPEIALPARPASCPSAATQDTMRTVDERPSEPRKRRNTLTDELAELFGKKPPSG